MLSNTQHVRIKIQKFIRRKHYTFQNARLCYTIHVPRLFSLISRFLILTPHFHLMFR
jgi:hypothetical protein